MLILSEMLDNLKNVFLSVFIIAASKDAVNVNISEGTHFYIIHLKSRTVRNGEFNIFFFLIDQQWSFV